MLAGDWAGAEDAARWALDAGAAGAESPIGRYAASLALLVLGRDAEARAHADAIRLARRLPPRVGDALAFLSARDVIGYTHAVEAVLESFERRDEYLEDMPVADTVLVLQALAARRGPRGATWSPRRFCPPPSPARRRVEDGRDDERLDVRLLELARPLRELGDQLQRLLRAVAGR